MDGNKSDVEQIIGNAVPVKLAEYIGRAVMEADRREELIVCSASELNVDYREISQPVQQWFVFEQSAKYNASDESNSKRRERKIYSTWE